MTNSGHEGQIFLSDPNTNNIVFFLLIIKFRKKKLPEAPDYSVKHDGVILM